MRFGKKKASSGRLRSVRASFFASYAAVLLTPILLSSVIFFGNYRLTEARTEEVFSVTGEHLTALLDTYVEETRNESLSLITNDYSQSLMYYTSTTPTTRQIIQLSNLQKEMLYKVTISNYVDSMYAVFPNSDIILTEQGVAYNHNFAYKCRDSLGMTLEEWDDFLRFEDNKRISIAKSSIDGKMRILMAQKNRNSSGEGVGMFIVTQLNVSAFQDILDELSQNGQSLAVLCDRESGNYIASSKAPEGLSWRMEEHGVVSDSASSVSCDLAFNSWTCALLTPRSIYFEAMSPLFFSIFLYLLICLAIGAVLISYLTKKQSSPVQALTAQMLAAIEQNPLSPEQNEYEQIQRALTVLLHRQASMKAESDLMRKSFQEHVLRNILSGRIKKDSIIYRHAYNNGVSFDADRFLVILYDIEDFGKAFSQLGGGTDRDSDDFLSSILDVVAYTAAQDPAQDRYTRYAVEIDGRIACIVCCPEGLETETIEGDMLRDADLVRSFLGSKFGLVLSAAVSSVQGDMEHINQCYQEALDTLDYMETMGMTTQTCRFGQISVASAEPNAPMDGILDKERQFCNCMKAGEYASSRRLLGEIIEDLHLESCSAAEARMRVFGLIGAVGPSLEEAQSELEEDGWTFTPETVLQTKDVNALCAQLLHLLDQLAESSSHWRSEKSSRQKDQFLQYVSDHLTDPNLNVSIAADYFGVSPSYLSRAFKKNIGVGFLDYIHQHRVDLAKEMIQRSPSMPLKDISEKVGYTTPLALNRAFRKYEGISPSVFREHCGGA